MTQTRSRVLLFLVLISLGLVACNAVDWHRDSLAKKYTRCGLQAQTFALSSGSMHAWVGGDGPPLVLVHGFGLGGMETWEKQIEAYAQNFTVIAPDLYWFGKSVPSDPANPGMADDQAKGLHELLTRLGVDRAHIMGVSFGGFVALEFARHYPQQTQKLVLIDAAGLAPTQQEEATIRANFDNPASLEDVLLPADVAGFRFLLDRIFYKPKWIPDFALKQILREDINQNRAQKAQICARLTGGGLLSPTDMQVIQAGTLVIWGRHDPLLLPSMGSRLAESINGAQIVFFEESGHTPMLEETARFNDTTLTFLSAP